MSVDERVIFFLRCLFFNKMKKEQESATRMRISSGFDLTNQSASGMVPFFVILLMVILTRTVTMMEKMNGKVKNYNLFFV